MASLSTSCFFGYTPLATPPGVTLVLDTPRFGAQTPVETLVNHTPIEIPLDTPLETPAETPRFTRQRREGLQYSVNLNDGIILDEDGKKVILRMRGLCSQWSMTRRDPTPYEHEYADKKGLHVVMDILTSCGGMNSIDTPLEKDETSD
ncbi:hypothetical protein L7F22_049290 [Adiantum nelumboides]|nr:hypothetical protein [Adiantum nelumboides]